jgi:peptide/nickel transport system substrate-binding protein
MNVKNKFLFLIVSLVLAAHITSCGTKTESSFDTLILRLDADPSTLDPALGTDVASGMIDSLLFSTLVRFDENLKLTGDIADSWRLSEDKTTYTFSLKNNIRFSNNRALMAKDVKYSFERVLNPKTRSPRAWLFRNISGAEDYNRGKASEVEGIKIMNDYELSITLDKPFSPFLSFLTMPAASVVPEEEIIKWGLDFSENPVGSGPWKLSRWTRDYKVVLENNPYYYATKPALEKLVFKILKEPLTILTEFELKHLDVMEPSAADILQYLDDQKLKARLLSRSGLNVYYLGLNCRKQPLNNPKVRLAVAHAIDAVSILKTIRRGRGTLAHGPIPPGLEGHDANLLPHKYDPSFSKKLLE